MTIHYVDSNAIGLNDGTSWANAFTSWQSALTAWNIGDLIYMASDHSEVYGTTTLTCPNATIYNPNITISVNKTTGQYAPKPAGIQFTGGTLTIAFSCWLLGLHVSFNYHNITSVNYTHHLIDCIEELGTQMRVQQRIYLDNTDVVFYAAASIVSWGASTFRMRGGSISGTASANGMIYEYAGGSDFDLTGVDVSAIDLTTYSADLVYFRNTAGYQSIIRFAACDLPAVITIGTIYDIFPATVIFSSCDSGGGLHRNERYTEKGSVITTTSVYRNNGYTDISDNTQVSNKMTPLSIVTAPYPLEGAPIMGYVLSTGVKTIEIEFAHNYTAAFNNDELGFDILAVDTVSEVTANIFSTHPGSTGAIRDRIATASALTTSVEAWTGAAGLTKQKASISVTFNRVGPFLIVPFLYKYEAGKTLYYDAKATIA